MDWFERLTGFKERSYSDTQRRLSVVDGRLYCVGAPYSPAVGTLTLPSLAELRTRAAEVALPGKLRLSIVEGDIRAMHRQSENEGALIQVASQFNMLEMAGPDVRPEEGVSRYAYDRTQGPACAIAAGGATIFRNYLVPVAGRTGQTAKRQLDGLAELGTALVQRLGPAEAPLWTMQNGYALSTKAALAAIASMLLELDETSRDGLRGLLRIGLHSDVEVTDGPSPGPLLSQILCSALPVAYSGLSPTVWAPFACLVLEAAYEATLLAGVLNAVRGGSNRVLLTRLGGGAFGNDDDWIDNAMARALQVVKNCALDVAIISYGRAPPSLRGFVNQSGFASI